MSKVAEQLREIKESIPENCVLIAVSKTKPNSDIETAYQVGHRDFGENKVQELVGKADALPKDIQWHMIGHLQRNKVKYIAPFVYLIHGVDSLKLLKEIDKQGKKVNRTINCLLQIHIATEETKFGLDEGELSALIQSEEFKQMDNINVCGLMGMATNTDDEEQVKMEFKSLKNLFDKLKDSDHTNTNISILSMGMSGDYQIAIEEGSSMVRIGSAIFGSRNYL